MFGLFKKKSAEDAAADRILDDLTDLAKKFIKMSRNQGPLAAFEKSMFFASTMAAIHQVYDVKVGPDSMFQQAGAFMHANDLNAFEQMFDRMGAALSAESGRMRGLLLMKLHAGER